VAATLAGGLTCASPLGAGTRPLAVQAPWCAYHLLGFETDAALLTLEEQLPALAARGVNVLILEVDYHFAFRSHPELAAAPEAITRAGARRLVGACRRAGLTLIPQFQCVGHQSWAQTTFPLLTRYPELDLTPGAFPNNEGLYCREWDVTNPRVNTIVFALLDEILDAFDAPALHVGLDEVFLLGHERSPATRGQDPAALFARAVNELHAHVVGQRGRTLLMWADRLIDGTRYRYGEWEASLNGTAGALERIPTDIILCDWHYEPRVSYPSLALFVERGFRVLPASWKDPGASRLLIDASQSLRHERMLGHLFTRWDGQHESLAAWPPLAENARLVRPSVGPADPSVR
jgi:hypothetical protein